MNRLALVGQRLVLVCALFIIAIHGAVLGGCKDKEKEVAAMMAPAFDVVLPLVERDTKQVRDGLPKGAKLMAKHLDSDPGSDIEGVKRALENARAGVDELEVAKSTFFIFVAPDGTVLRSQHEPDLPAGRSITKAIADTKPMLKPDAGLVETWGYMEGLRGVNKGDDLQWVVGHPVVDTEGKLLGSFMTGWSLRKYAEYLENHVKIHLQQQRPDKTKPIPLVYTFVIKGAVAYGGPMTPDENAKALGDLGLPQKVRAGVAEGAIEVDGRRFVFAAKAAPSFGDDVAIAVLMSPI